MSAICVIFSYQISGIYRQYSKDWYNHPLNRCVVFIWWLLLLLVIILFNKYPLVQHPHGHHTFALVTSIPVVISYENDSWKCNQSGRKQKRNLYLSEPNIIKIFSINSFTSPWQAWSELMIAAKISNLTLSTQSPREQCSIAALHSSCMQSHKNEHSFWIGIKCSTVAQ